MMEKALQTAVFTRLSGYEDLTDALPTVPLPNGTTAPAIFDNYPQPGDTGAQLFPFVSLGEGLLGEWDTDDTFGGDGEVVLHVWSRERGRREVKTLQGYIYAALHRYNLAVEGYTLVALDWVSSESFMDPDGVTRHGVSRFRVLLEQ